jgi:dienelactone hydrolase
MTSDQSGWTDHFAGNFQWSNPMLVCKGMAPYGAVALDELERIGQQLRSRATEPNAWNEAWSAMAAMLEQRGDEAHALGRAHTAGDYYLRAGYYFYTGERFVPPGLEKRALGERAFRCLRRGLAQRHPNIDFVELPYERTTLPALFLRAPGASDRAPTVVVFNGMDNCKEMSVLFAGLEFARRGFHTLAVDGPGMGETQRLRGIPARYDYEVPAGAAFDWLAARRDVDAQKIVVMGYSFGGYYATRIAAYDHRFAAAVALTAPHWDLAGYQQKLLDRARAASHSVAQSNFQFPWVMGATDADHAIELARGFNVEQAAAKVVCPMLVTHGEHDRVIPVENAHKLYAALGTSRKHLKIFSREEGGCEHAHVDNRQVGIDYAADWITETLNTL